MKTENFIHGLIIMISLSAINASGQSIAKKANEKGIAVLELFTSEGCSSCPPADALMGKIYNEYKNKEVYILSYHVDYWDKQGWNDIFSNAQYSKRQYDYANWMGREPVYTPQVVINGVAEHIGSQESIIKTSIAQQLSRPAMAQLSLKAIQNKNKLTVSHTVKGASKNSRLLIAIVQKTAQSKIKRGENEGRLLSHYQIVRDLHTIDFAANGKGSSTFSLPKDYNTKDFEIIGFVQDSKNGAVLGATKAIF